MTAADLATIVPDSREIKLGEYAAPCPSCGGDPRSRRFRFRDGDDRVLIWCHACQNSEAILGALNLRWKDLRHNTAMRLDPEVSRRQDARKRLAGWRSSELTGICERLRHLQLLEDQASRRLKVDTDDPLAWDLLAYVYAEQPALEHEFSLLTLSDEAGHIEVFMERKNAA